MYDKRMPWMAVAEIQRLRHQTKLPKNTSERVENLITDLAEIEIESAVVEHLFG